MFVPSMIRPATTADAESIATIYNHYVTHTVVTFEEEEVSVAEMAQRIAGVLQKHPYYVFEEHNHIRGFAYASDWKGRCSYRYSVESTVYLAPDCVGKGIGSALYTQLLQDLRQRGMHVVIGGVSLPNSASVALHEKMGFEKVAHFKEVGHKHGQWLDVGYWQLTFQGTQ